MPNDLNPDHTGKTLREHLPNAWDMWSWDIPDLCKRSKTVTCKPAFSAPREMTVGGNCCGSPAMTTDSAPLTNGIRVEGSVAWVASSMTTSLKICLCSRFSSPAPAHVAATTWRRALTLLTLPMSQTKLANLAFVCLYNIFVYPAWATVKTYLYNIIVYGVRSAQTMAFITTGRSGWDDWWLRCCKPLCCAVIVSTVCSWKPLMCHCILLLLSCSCTIVTYATTTWNYSGYAW